MVNLHDDVGQSCGCFLAVDNARKGFKAASVPLLEREYDRHQLWTIISVAGAAVFQQQESSRFWESTASTWVVSSLILLWLFNELLDAPLISSCFALADSYKAPLLALQLKPGWIESVRGCWVETCQSHPGLRHWGLYPDLMIQTQRKLDFVSCFICHTFGLKRQPVDQLDCAADEFWLFTTEICSWRRP